jgi:hypothetical protein
VSFRANTGTVGQKNFLLVQNGGINGVISQISTKLTLPSLLLKWIWINLMKIIFQEIYSLGTLIPTTQEVVES